MTQSEALDLLKLGHNVFLTGAAGSGKTYLLNQYITYLREHGVAVAVTASTGIAATHLGGVTIHSFSGIGVSDEMTLDEIEALANKERVRRNFKKTSVLIIDEVSMLHAYQLDMVDMIARSARGNSEPFGGMQVILCGDFFQLPPVSKNFGNNKSEKKFAYECSAWDEGGFQICYLEEQFRQGDDPLMDVLNMIRAGNAGEEAKVHLRTRYKKDPIGTTKPIKLYSRNINIDALNSRELGELSTEEKIFTMESRGFKALVETLKRSCLTPEYLPLKIGAEVMFVKNSQEGRYVNGTRGIIESFHPDEGWPIVRTHSGDVIIARPEEWRLEENGAVRASISQVPLRLAWAITVHKSQGMTLDNAEVDLSDAFEPGMGYVALSRVRSLSGLKLMGLNETALSVNPKILSHDKNFREWSQMAREALKGHSSEAMSRYHEDILFNRFKGARDKTKVKKGKIIKEATHEVTRRLIEQKLSLTQIAKERGITMGTVIGHLEKLQGLSTLPDISYLKPKKKDFDVMLTEFKKSEDGKLLPIHEKLKGKYSFEELRLVRLFV